MSTSPNLRLPYLDANQNQKTVTHNAALRMLDALVNLHVASAALAAPPGGPNDGQCWIVASGGTGAWLGKDLNVAAWQDGAWAFYAPNPGFVAYVDALGGALMWNGSAWVSLLGAVASLALATLGLGTAADPANPLSARLNAALFAALPTTAVPAGTGDVRVKLSKQGGANAASLLFQDAFSGRAEIGLLGDDNFHFKVSPDGSTFTDALVLAASGGAAAFTAIPTHPSPAPGDSSTASATTAWVAGKGYATAAAAAAAAPVQSVAGRGGAVALGVADVAGAAPSASPAFTGTPTGPTPAAKDNSTRLATTAYADRGNAAAIARSQVADAAYAVLASDRTVAVIALTAARTLTLPAASAYPQGVTLTVVDESGACSATATLTLQVPAPPSGQAADQINGASSAVIASPYGYLALQGNGFNKWTVVDQSTLGMGQQSAAAVAITGGTVRGLSAAQVGANGSPGSSFAVSGQATASGGGWGAGNLTVGNTTSGGAASSAALGFGFYGNVGYIAAIAPGVSWYPLRMQVGSCGVYSSGSGTPGLFQDPSGNVAVGNSAPATTLDVSGPVRPGSYTVATLPAGVAGALAFAGNGRKVGEGAGAGTGVLVAFSNSSWRRPSDDTAVAS